MRMYMFLSVMIIGSCSLFAQALEMMGGKSQRPMERLENYKKIRMIEVLNLDEETGLKLVGRYSKHREAMKQIEENRTAVIDKLESQLKSNTSDAELQKSFNEFYDVEKKVSEARKKFIEELKDILTHKQIAEYMIFERSFMTDLRKVVKDVQKERRQRN